jgi:hypothetical protein
VTRGIILEELPFRIRTEPELYSRLEDNMYAGKKARDVSIKKISYRTTLDACIYRYM